MTGYTRQSAATIVASAEVKAAPLNAEFNQLQSAFGTSGHTHDGTSGNGPQISLTSAVSGRLPLANITTIADMKVWGNVSGSSGTAAEVSILDEDAMTSNSATAIPTQQSVKAYVDNNAVFKTGAQTITGLKLISTGTAATSIDYLMFEPTDYGVGKPGLYISHGASADLWEIETYDGTTSGQLNILTGTLYYNSSEVVSLTNTKTLTNKTLTAPVINGNVTGTYTLAGTPTFPSTVVLTTASQTLTNKTLTSPIISTISNTGTLTLPTSTDTLVGRATTDTLTNKTLTSPTINTATVTSPTVSGASLTTSTFTGGTFAGTIAGTPIYSGLQTITAGTSTAGTDFLAFKPSDYAAGKPGLFIKKALTATRWDVNIYDGVGNTGTIYFSCSGLQKNGEEIITDVGTFTMTNKTLTSPVVNSGTFNNVVVSIVDTVVTSTAGSFGRFVAGTYTKPSNLIALEVILVGGGGGGGGADGDNTNPAVGSPGGSGGLVKKLYLNSALSATETYTVGAAGTGGSGVFGANDGTNGGNTTFKTLTAGGGTGGTGRTGIGTNRTFGGAGGTASNGDINIVGQQGGMNVHTGGTCYAQGVGGSAPLGYGFGAQPADIVSGTFTVGNNATGYGSGGGGGTASQSTASNLGVGGNGTAGVIIVREYLAS